MLTTDQDIHFMRQALDLAKNGIYSTKPNPAVGCVLVLNGKVIAQGWHHKAGMPHAERVALANAKQAGIDVTGSTAYVTLEPCSHYGRTPPCTEGLIEAGIARCVVATLDPNPQVAGRGLQRLQTSGVEVVSGVCEAQAEAINTSFLFSMRNQRPYVWLKMASSLDGKTAMANGESQWITGPESRLEVHRLRARAGAIITGMGTVQADNPSLTIRLPVDELSRMQLDATDTAPLRVILDTNLTISEDAKILQQAGKTLICCSAQAVRSDKVQDLISDNVEIVAMPLHHGKIDLSSVLKYLFKEKSIIGVLVEAGATLAGAFIEQGLVNELHSYVAPCLLGSDARGMFALPNMQSMHDKIEFEIADTAKFGDDIRLILLPKK